MRVLHYYLRSLVWGIRSDLLKLLKNEESHRVAWRIFMARDSHFCQHFRELWLGTRVFHVWYAYERLFNIRRVYTSAFM